MFLLALQWERKWRPREEGVMDSGVRGRWNLCPSACALGFSPWVNLTLNILWDAVWSFYIVNISISKQLHLCWHNSKSIWYTIQLGRECRIFPRRKITFSNGSLFLIFLKRNQWIRLNLPPKCSRGSTVLWLHNATGFHVEIVLMLPCRNRFKSNEQS